VAAGSFVVREVPVPAGPATLAYVAQDLAGNTSATGEAVIDVFETAPTVSITAPLTGANLGFNDDLDRATPGLQYSVQIGVSDVPAGTLGTLLTGARTYTFVPPIGATGSVTRPIALEDGAHELRARVQDPCGNSVESAPVVVTVFSAPPPLRVTPYVADNTPCAPQAEVGCATTTGCMWNPTGTASCVADFGARQAISDGALVPEATIDLDVVTGPGVAGHPRLVSLTIYPAVTGVGVDRHCSGAPSVSGPSASVLETAGGVLFANLALAPGLNCFEVTVADGINTLVLPVVVSRKNTVPTISLTAPDAGALTDSDGDATNGFNQTVVATLAAAAKQITKTVFLFL